MLRGAEPARSWRDSGLPGVGEKREGFGRLVGGQVVDPGAHPFTNKVFERVNEAPARVRGDTTTVRGSPVTRVPEREDSSNGGPALTQRGHASGPRHAGGGPNADPTGGNVKLCPAPSAIADASPEGALQGSSLERVKRIQDGGIDLGPSGPEEVRDTADVKGDSLQHKLCARVAERVQRAMRFTEPFHGTSKLGIGIVGSDVDAQAPHRVSTVDGHAGCGSAVFGGPGRFAQTPRTAKDAHRSFRDSASHAGGSRAGGRDVEGSEVGVDATCWEDNLAVVHVPSVPNPATSVADGGGRNASDGSEDGSAVKPPEGVTLLGTSIDLDRVAAREVDGPGGLMQPLGPRADARNDASHSFADGPPFERRKRVAQVNVDNRNGFVDGTRKVPLDQGARVDQRLGSVQRADPVLPRLAAEPLHGILVRIQQAFTDKPSPDLAHTYGAWLLFTGFLQENQSGVPQPLGGLGKVSFGGPSNQVTDCLPDFGTDGPVADTTELFEVLWPHAGGPRSRRGREVNTPKGPLPSAPPGVLRGTNTPLAASPQDFAAATFIGLALGGGPTWRTPGAGGGAGAMGVGGAWEEESGPLVLLVGPKVGNISGKSGHGLAVGGRGNHGALSSLGTSQSRLLGDHGVQLLPLVTVPQPDPLLEFGA